MVIGLVVLPLSIMEYGTVRKGVTTLTVLESPFKVSLVLVLVGEFPVAPSVSFATLPTPVVTGLAAVLRVFRNELALSIHFALAKETNVLVTVGPKGVALAVWQTVFVESVVLDTVGMVPMAIPVHLVLFPFTLVRAVAIHAHVFAIPILLTLYITT